MASQTYNYGKDAQGNQVYESSTPGGAVNPSQAITSASLAPTAPIAVPPAPTPTDLTPHIANGMAVIGANSATLNPPVDPNAADTSSTDLFTKYLGSLTPPASSADQYNQDYQSSGIDSAQTDLNTKNAAVKAAQSKLAATNASIAGITAGAQAMNLQQEGRHTVQAQVLGQQAENNRQAAIQAIPLQVQALANQAEVASAQGDATLSESILKQAQTHLDTLFQIHAADAKSAYDYKTSLINAVYQFADKQQQAKLDAQKTKQAEDFARETQQIGFQHDFEKAKLDEQLKQSDPLYKAQLAKTYADIQNSQANQTLNGKPQTTIQAQVQGYADRTNQADVILAKLGSQFASSSLGNIIGSNNPINMLKSSDRQQYEQAQRDFVNAVLRRESGAAISASEFDSYGKQYFPQLGDSAATIAQKAANRQTTINNLYQQSNTQRGALPGQIIESDGQQYKVGDDGQTLIPL